MGIAALGVSLDPARVEWVLLVATTVVGIVPIVGIGVVLAAVCIPDPAGSMVLS